MTRSISPALHQVTGGVVGDDLVGDALLGQFPGGQGRTLAARAGFVAEDVKAFALRLGGIDGRGGGADIHERQPAGVAVGEDAHAVANQLGAVPADGLAVLDVFVGELLGGRQRQRLLLRHGVAGSQDAAHLVHRVDRVHGGGPGGLEGAVDCLQVRREAFQVVAAKGARALGQTIGGGGADGAGAAHDHVADGPGRFAEVPRGHDLKPMRQKPLLDELNLVGWGIEPDGAVVFGDLSEGDVHKEGQQVWKPAIQQTWKSALQLASQAGCASRVNAEL